MLTERHLESCDLSAVARYAARAYRAAIARRSRLDTPIAYRFLTRLGYLDHVGRPMGGPARQRHRLGMLQYAAQCERLFLIDRPFDEDARLVGATVGVAQDGVLAGEVTHIHAGGRGLDFRQAFESCLGEMAERSAALERRGERDHPAVGHHLLDETRVYFPGTVLFGGAQPASTGCAAAPDRAAAIKSAVLERVERDATSRWWHRQVSPPPATRDLHAPLERLFGPPGPEDRDRWLLDLTTEAGIPVMAAISAAPDGTGIVVGSAAGMDSAEAAEKAALELYQMEHAAALAIFKADLMDSDALQPGDRLWISRLEADDLETFPCFRPADTAPQRHAPLSSVNALLDRTVTHHGDGYVFYRPSPVEILSVVKVWFPRMSQTAPRLSISPAPV